MLADPREMLMGADMETNLVSNLLMAQKKDYMMAEKTEWLSVHHLELDSVQ